MKRGLGRRNLVLIIGILFSITLGIMVIFQHPNYHGTAISELKLRYENAAVSFGNPDKSSRKKTSCTREGSRLYEYLPRMHLDMCTDIDDCLKTCEVWDGETLTRDLPQLQMLSPLFVTERAQEVSPLVMDEVLSALEAYESFKNPQQNTESVRSPNKESRRRLSDYSTSPYTLKSGGGHSRMLQDVPGNFTTCSSMAAMANFKIQKEFQKGMRTAIVTVAELGNSNGSKASLKDKNEYASRWGYDMLTFQKLHPSRHTAWSKIPALLSVMHMYDYIWALDLDTVIMDHTIPIDSLFDDRFELIFTVDRNGMNSGSVIIRPSDWVRGFLAEAWTITNVERSNIWWEQAAYLHLLKDYRLMNHVKLINQSYMNDYPLSKGNTAGIAREGSFVLHFAGQGDTKWDRLALTLPLRNLGRP